MATYVYIHNHFVIFNYAKLNGDFSNIDALAYASLLSSRRVHFEVKKPGACNNSKKPLTIE